MIFNEKTIILKDGRTAVLKSPAVEDAAKMLDYIKTATGETDFLTRYPEEWEAMSIDKEEKWIKNALNSVGTMLITCYIDGKIVGNCGLTVLSGMKMCHRATVGIAILKEYWNLGIGSSMFREMIDAAKASGIEIMELEFVEGNDRGRRLYEKFGFTVIGKRPNAFKLKDGTMLAEFLMQKYL